MNKASINIRVDKDFKTRLDALSLARYQSLTALIIMALVEKFPELKEISNDR